MIKNFNKKQLVVDLKSTTNKKSKNNFQETIDLVKLFNKERDISTKYRFNLILNPFCTNVLYNNNSYIRDNYLEPGIDIFNSYQLRNKLFLNNSDIITNDRRMFYSFNESIQQHLLDQNGWLGFHKPLDRHNFCSNEIKDVCDFYDLFPGREYYSFDKNNENWHMFLTYTSSIVRNSPLVTNNSKESGIPVITVKSDKRTMLLEMETIYKHNLRENDTVVFYEDLDVDNEGNLNPKKDIELFNKKFQVYQVGDQYGNNKEKVFSIMYYMNPNEYDLELKSNDSNLNWLFNNNTNMLDISFINDEKLIEFSDDDVVYIKTNEDEILNYKFNITKQDKKLSIKSIIQFIESNNEKYKLMIGDSINFSIVKLNQDIVNFRVAKITNGVESSYYLRKVKPLKNINMDSTKNGFSKTIFSDNSYQLNSLVDVDLSNMKDHLGRPIHELFLSVVKNTTIKGKSKLTDYDEDIHDYLPVFNNLSSGFDLDVKMNSNILYGVKNGNVRYMFSSKKGEIYNQFSSDTGNISLDSFPKYKLDKDSEDPFDKKVYNWYLFTRQEELDAITFNQKTKSNNEPVINYSKTLKYIHDEQVDDIFFTKDSKSTLLDEYFCDIVEYNPVTLKETVLCDIMHRFNTFNRDYCCQLTYNNGLSDITLQGVGPKIEGYMYKPHHKISIKNLSQPNITKLTKFVVGKPSDKIRFRSKTEDGTSFIIHESYPNDLWVYGNQVSKFNDDSLFKLLFIDDFSKTESYSSKIYNTKKRTNTCIVIKDIVSDLQDVFKDTITYKNEGAFKYMYGFNIIEFNKYIPDYIKNIKSDLYGWLDIESESITDEMSELKTPHGFINNSHYVFSQINFYLKRQDPFGDYGYRFVYAGGGINLDDVEGNLIEHEEIKVNNSYDVC